MIWKKNFSNVTKNYIYYRIYFYVINFKSIKITGIALMTVILDSLDQLTLWYYILLSIAYTSKQCLKNILHYTFKSKV